LYIYTRCLEHVSCSHSHGSLHENLSWLALDSYSVCCNFVEIVGALTLFENWRAH